MFYIKMADIKRKHDERVKEETIINVEYKTGSLPDYLGSRQGSYDSLSRPVQSGSKSCSSCFTSTRFQLLLCVFTIIFGVCSVISATYVNVNNSIQYATVSKPCIYNMTFYI